MKKRGRPTGQHNGNGHVTLVGGTLRRYRVAFRISQKELGAVIGTTDTFIARVEAGKCGLPFPHITKIAEKLRCSRDMLAKFVIEDLIKRKNKCASSSSQ